MSFELHPTGTEQPPAFLTPVACEDWIAGVPLANAVQAQSMFLKQLNLLHRYSLPVAERFAILETLRGPVCDAQEDVAKKFAGRPLPFSPPEQAALDSTLAVWHALALGYLRCFEAARAKDDGIAAQAATVAQRTLSVFADWQVDLCRGEQLPDAAYWAELNRLFAAIEAMGVAGQAVNDPVRHGNMTVSPLAAYAECQLLHTASPYELPARHLAWVARWARRWGVKLSLITAPPEDIRNRAVPLWVDIESDRPAGYLPRPSAGSRWLETTGLRSSIVNRITLLDQGRAPAEMQLGDDVTQPAAGQLLARVLQRWCKGGAARRHERRPASGHCNFIAGFEAVHYHLSGKKVFHRATKDDATLRREKEELETFGQISQRHAKEEGGGDHVEHWEVMDDWRLLDESVSGLRITRPLKEGVRIGAGLLIAAQVPGAEGYVLGTVRWALREGDNALSAGIQLFPGAPRAVAVRPVEPGNRELFKQGFLLPAVPETREAASVVLPVGTFRLGRSVEAMVDDKTQTLKLVKILDRGAEFERCAYEV